MRVARPSTSTVGQASSSSAAPSESRPSEPPSPNRKASFREASSSAPRFSFFRARAKLSASKRSSSPSKGTRSAAHDARVFHGASQGRSARSAASKASSAKGEAEGESGKAAFRRAVSSSTIRRAKRRASRSVTPKRATAKARHTARKVLGSKSARRSNAPRRPCTSPNAVPADARTAAATAGGTTTRSARLSFSFAPPPDSEPERRPSPKTPENSSSSFVVVASPPAAIHAPCLVAAHSPATNGDATRANRGVAPFRSAAFTTAAVSRQWWCPRSSADALFLNICPFGSPRGAGVALASTARVCSTVRGGIAYDARDAGAPDCIARATCASAFAFSVSSDAASLHASTNRTASGGDCGSHLKCSRRSTRWALDVEKARVPSENAPSTEDASSFDDASLETPPRFCFRSSSSQKKSAGAFSLGSRPATATAPTPAYGAHRADSHASTMTTTRRCSAAVSRNLTKHSGKSAASRGRGAAMPNAIFNLAHAFSRKCAVSCGKEASANVCASTKGGSPSCWFLLAEDPDGV
mmetsp:Transcript_8258/g.35064  ORF Transcript_8258/g.35064 Transcript_8258/m.35064 type:complete len:528 (-) Transcript_8258:466-2049(-)